MKIDKDLLKSWSACADGYKWFIAKFPQGGDVHEVGTALREGKRYADASWLAINMFNHFTKAPQEIAGYVESDVAAILKSVEGSPNSVSGNYSMAASSGYYSMAASSGNSSTASAEGEKTIAMVAGTNGRAKAGVKGAFALAWYDEANEQMQIAVGVVGTDGVKADTWYRVTDGKLEETK